MIICKKKWDNTLFISVTKRLNSENETLCHESRDKFAYASFYVTDRVPLQDVLAVKRECCIEISRIE